MIVKAVIFDLFKTLGEFDSYITDEQVSELLLTRGYPVYPQMWKHAFSFVIFIDYPKHGYGSYGSIFKQVFNRLDLDVDSDTISELTAIFENSRFELYPGSMEAIKLAKSLGLKTAICTTTPRPFFIEEIKPIHKYLDFICTGYEAGFEKSNPAIYQKVLDKLQIIASETVVIGDDPLLDMRNGKQMGFHTIQITQTGDVSVHADYFTKNVLESISLIDGLAS